MSEKKIYRFRVHLSDAYGCQEDIVEDELDHPPTNEDFQAALMEGLSNMVDFGVELLDEEQNNGTRN